MPHFIGIGAMRAGTSWFAAHLARHPSIWLGRKEIHFFDRKIDRRRIPFLDRDLEARIRYGLRFLPGIARGRICGEFTPSYAILEPDRIARVHNWMPEVKLLFIMRDPVERVWSQVKHDFPRWLGMTAEQAPRSRLVAFFESPSVRRRGDYAQCLARWLRYYDREQFFLTFLEDVAADPSGVLNQAFSFLGVTPDAARFPDVSRPVHTSDGPTVPDWVREYLTDSLSTQNKQLEALVGRPLPWTVGQHCLP